ncbi:alpha/beta hydrolase [Leifsonia sp. NPDC077715]|uniref:alpha/beta hydrolase n=1 Tax=Leifsonia sp. NPDC077715 TaxID=3155539 RepID=UPI0034328868
MKDALRKNLATATSVLNATRGASDHLVGAVNGGALSGKGYAAIGSLFGEVIRPSLMQVKTGLDGLRADYERFSYEDSKISHFGVLKEDELNMQVAATKRQRDATTRLIEANNAVMNAVTIVPGLSEVLQWANSRLEMVVAQLDNDVRDLEGRIQALQQFDTATRGLFQKSLPRTVTATFKENASRADPHKVWTGSELMNLLSLRSPAEVERMLARNPGLVQEFWDSPPPADEVASWWATLSPEQREKWCQAAPAVVGNLPGLDADTRIHANMIQFQRDFYDRGIDPKSPRGIVLGDIMKALGVDAFSGPLLDYEKLARELSPARGLLAYNSTAQPPLAAIAVGETRAEKLGKVTWAVPGMGNGLGQPDRLFGWTNAAANLYQAQEIAEPGVAHMVVAWIGYASPGDVSVLWGDRARAGAARLAKELDGQWAAGAILGGNPKPFTAVVGHSYGTTVVANALGARGALAHNVQSVVLLASAGVDNGILSAASLSVDGGAGRVYASQSSQDQVADVGRYYSGRGDPRDELFNAKVFSSEGDLGQNLEPTDGHDTRGHGSDRGGLGALAHATAGHGYLDPGTEAINNTAAASLGLDGKINGGTHTGRDR